MSDPPVVLDAETRARLIATLTRRFGDIDLAEDSLHEAVLQAVRTWPGSGEPDNPVAWLTTVAKRKAFDAVRREDLLARKIAELHIVQDRPDGADPVGDAVGEGQAGRDDRLAMLIACCHPALTPADRVAMTLRFAAGRDTRVVADLLLLPVPTLQQRITRAKKRIRTLGISFAVPGGEALAERLDSVLKVIYLIYTDGFARSTGQAHVRDDLTEEAVRLARLVHRLEPGSAETTGLLALLLLTEARRPARVTADGRPVPLEHQDRTRWSARLRDEGLVLAERAARMAGARTYAIQGAIAAVHAEAPTFADTDWRQIAVLYRILGRYESGPAVRLATVIAVGRAEGLQRGSELLDELSTGKGFDDYRPFHVARAVTYRELGDRNRAASAYRRALELPGNGAEDRFLEDMLSEVTRG
jgi:RNA polymerase sigma-70 factor (ECF subfamily)